MFAWAGPAPARAAAASGAPVDLPDATGRRDGSGLPGSQPIAAAAGLLLGAAAGLALDVQRSLLARGYITSLGGGRRESIVLTPPLDITETLLEGFVAAFQSALAGALG